MEMLLGTAQHLSTEILFYFFESGEQVGRDVVQGVKERVHKVCSILVVDIE